MNNKHTSVSQAKYDEIVVDLKLLSEISKKINTYTDVDAILAVVLEHLNEYFGINAYTLYLADYNTLSLHVTSFVGWSTGVSAKVANKIRHHIVPLNETWYSLVCL